MNRHVAKNAKGIAWDFPCNIEPLGAHGVMAVHKNFRTSVTVMGMTH
jgi:hypothetical protein